MARNTSTAYKTQIAGSRQFCVKAVLTYADGTTETLTDLSDFRQIKIEDSCSGSSEFEIGAAIINEAVIVLNNRTGKFDEKNFFGARIVLYVGIWVNDQPELLKMGHYVVNDPVSPGISIQLTAYDHMIFTEQIYVPGIAFPATRAQIAQDACTQCGLQMLSADFPAADEIVAAAPEGATCREVLAAIAQLGCAFVRCNNDGLVEIRWYSTTTDHAITDLRSKSICTDDVIITGVTVANGEVSVAAGEDGYRIGIKDNILMVDGQEQATADYLASKLVGMRFRPLAVKCRSNPAMEAGDKVQITDEKGKKYESYITTTIFIVLDAQTVSCDAATPAENSSQRNSQIAKAIIASKKYTEAYVKQELTEYEKAEKLFSGLLIGALGYYETVETMEDGSTIRYMHDKSDLAESLIIWKQTIDGFAVSTDGGQTWKGMDKNGNAVMNVLSVYGLNAGWINSGTFAARDPDGNIVFAVNVETGEVLINAASITMTSGKTVQQEVDALQGQVDGLQIGGRNLWLNSTFDAELDGYTNNHQYGGQIEVISDGYTGHKALRLDRSAYTGSNRCYLMSNKPPAVQEYKAGDTFILSAWVYIEQTLTQAHNQRESAIMVRGTSGDKPQITIPNTTPVGQWTFLSEVHTFGADGSFANTFVMLGGNGTMLVSCIKLEQGNIATDWTPAPEDTDARVSVVEATVEQQAEEIAEKISKDKIVAAINMSEEEIQILAAKLKLEGLITANGGFKILEDGSPEITAGHIKILGSSEDDSIISLLYKYKNEVWESTISPRTSTFARYYIPNPETEEVTASSQIHVRGDLIRLENWDETAGELADSTDITPEGIATSGTVTAKEIKISGTQETFALANSTKTFAFSETDYPPGTVAELTITGNAGVAYALILFSSTMTLAVNSSTWTGNGSIKLTQTNSRAITFTYTGTGAATFTSKIIVK